MKLHYLMYLALCTAIILAKEIQEAKGEESFGKLVPFFLEKC